MKLRYFIPAFIALVGAMLVSCSDEDTVTLLNEIQVSRSYVPINIDGGEATIDVTSQADWSIDGSNIPEWLTVSPMQGKAGETKVTFSAPAAPDGRSAELIINCADRAQHINVIQGLATVQDATCAEVIAGPDSKTYRVTGTVTRIENTVYGNWWLVDDTGEIYIYGTLDKQGKTKNFLSLGLEEGDLVTVEGPKTTYGTKIELVDVTVLKIVKSLLKVESINPEDSIPKEGGDVTIGLSCKGNGLTVEIPDKDKSWLSISNITGGSNPTVTFHANANAGGNRSSVVTFKTSNGSQESAVTATINQVGSIIECSVAQFLAAPEDETLYRLTGVIQSVKKADSGDFYLRDWSGTAYVYHMGAKGEFNERGLKEGDIVTIVGKRSSYNGEPQVGSGSKYETHIPVTDITMQEFFTKPDDKNVYYRITAEICSLKDKNGNDNVWGNMFITDGDDELYVYGLYPGWGATGDNRKGWVEAAGIEEGDILTTIGYKDTFGGLVEICGGIYFSHKKPGK
jgi:DNA/RNA endonuclease YhcR with UshA esterase domain